MNPPPTHIFFSLTLRHFYLNWWILISGDSVVWLHFTKMFTNFGGKKAEWIPSYRLSLWEAINHFTLLSSILARQRCLKILGNVLCWLHIYQFYRIVSPVLFWFRWYQWYFCGINGCEDTNRNVCLYMSFSEGIALYRARRLSVSVKTTAAKNVCRFSDCGTLVASDNGAVYTKVAVFSCITGYYRDGRNYGTWSGTPPACKSNWNV